MSSSWAFTRTAVKRFMTIHGPRESEMEAQRLLSALASRAGRLRELTPMGDFQWKVEEPPMILVTKRQEGLNLCVTVRRDGSGAAARRSRSEQELLSELALDLGRGVPASGSSRQQWALRESRLLAEKRRLEERLQASEAQRAGLAEAYARLREGLRIAVGTLKDDPARVEVAAALREIEREAPSLLAR
jgi:hypothetical protein